MRIVRKRQYTYLMLNKPRGYITTASDERGRKTVMDLLTGVDRRVYPIGRLDKDSEGLLLLTDDGAFANLLTHPSGGVGKLYRVTVRPRATEEQVVKMSSGVVLDDGVKTSPPSSMLWWMNRPHGDTVDADVAERGRAAVHGVGRLFPHPAVFFGRAAAVVHIKNKRAEHALHYQIRQAQILDTAAAAAARLDAQTAVGTREHTVRDRDIAHAAAHLAADDYAAVSVHKQTVCNDDVLAGCGARRFLGAGFQCDAVIANVNAAVRMRTSRQLSGLMPSVLGEL